MAIIGSSTTGPSPPSYQDFPRFMLLPFWEGLTSLGPDAKVAPVGTKVSSKSACRERAPERRGWGPGFFFRVEPPPHQLPREASSPLPQPKPSLSAPPLPVDVGGLGGVPPSWALVGLVALTGLVAAIFHNPPRIRLFLFRSLSVEEHVGNIQRSALFYRSEDFRFRAGFGMRSRKW